MSKWRLAHSLDQLRDEVNERWSNRSKRSDGTIGDVAHRRRRSDHNPNANSVVTAIDITHDERYDVAHKLWHHLLERKDKRVKYMIFNRRIVASYRVGSARPWRVRPYYGANPHTSHIHVSVVGRQSLYDDRDSWGITDIGRVKAADQTPTKPVEEGPELNDEERQTLDQIADRVAKLEQRVPPNLEDEVDRLRRGLRAVIDSLDVEVEDGP